MIATLFVVLSVVMIAVAGYHLLRLAQLVRTRVRTGADLDVGHAAMGAAMAAMLLGVATPATSAPGLLAVAFAVAAAWFGVRVVRDFVLTGMGAVVPLAQPALGCAAMVLMLAGSGAGFPSRPMPGMSMGSPSGSTGPAGALLAVVLIAGTVVLATRTVHREGIRVRHVGRGARPGLALGCQLAMNVTTVAMLALG